MEVLRKFAAAPGIRERQWKFVISRPEDVGEVQQILTQIGGVPADDVVLMAEGTTVEVLQERGAWLAERCKQQGYRFSPRLHVVLWGNRRGT